MMLDFKNCNYVDNEYTSIWIGCDLLVKNNIVRGYFYDDISEYYYNEEREMLVNYSVPCMSIGEAFEFGELDEDFYYMENFEPTSDIKIIASYLPSVAKDNCEKIFQRRFGEKINTKFNYLIIAPHMRYDGHIGKIKNKQYGEIVFLGVYKGF